MDNASVALAPFMPPPPDGVSKGEVHVSYVFTVSTRDPLGNPSSCRFDWGDGEKSKWTEPCPPGATHALAHAWNKPGKYDVCAQARNIRGARTCWGPAVRVTITDNDREASGVRLTR